MSARGEAALDSAKDAIIRVGDGRGFLMNLKTTSEPVVVTAAHCLPNLPPAHPASYTAERTYRNLLGALDTAPTVWAECLFVDPVADVAVLSAPDGQALYNECEAYERFVEGRPTVRLAALTRRSPAWLLTLDRHWEKCTVDVEGNGRALTLFGAHVTGGMSGSPILRPDGRAMGIVSMGSESAGIEHHEQYGQPALVANLPSWLLVELLTSVKALPQLVQAQSRINRQRYDRLRRELGRIIKRRTAQ